MESNNQSLHRSQGRLKRSIAMTSRGLIKLTYIIGGLILKMDKINIRKLMLSLAVSSPLPGIRKWEPSFALTDIQNSLHERRRVIMAAKQVIVEPESVNRFVPDEKCTDLHRCNRLCDRKLSGRIEYDIWNRIGELTSPINKLPVLQFAEQRWIEGRTWDETNAIEWHEKKIALSAPRPYKGTLTRNDVLSRLASLDKVFFEVKNSRNFKTRRELHFSFRAEGSPTVHLGPGVVVLGPNGYWRFAMAHVLRVALYGVIALCHPSYVNAVSAGKNEG